MALSQEVLVKDEIKKLEGIAFKKGLYTRLIMMNRCKTLSSLESAYASIKKQVIISYTNDILSSEDFCTQLSLVGSVFQKNSAKLTTK